MIDSTVRHRGSLIVRSKRQGGGATRDRQECHSGPDAGCVYPLHPRNNALIVDRERTGRTGFRS